MASVTNVNGYVFNINSEDLHQTFIYRCYCKAMLIYNAPMETALQDWSYIEEHHKIKARFAASVHRSRCLCHDLST